MHECINAPVQSWSPKQFTTGSVVIIKQPVKRKDGKDTFYYTDGYLRLVLDAGDVKLANKKIIRFANRQKLGGFGEPSQSSIDTYNSMAGQNSLKELVAKEIITMAIDSVFYIKDQLGNFKVVNKKNLLEIYPKNEKI